MKQKLIKTLQEHEVLEYFFAFGVNRNEKQHSSYIHPRQLVVMSLMYIVALMPAIFMIIIWDATHIALFNPDGWLSFIVFIVCIIAISIEPIAVKIGSPILKVLSILRIYTCTQNRIRKIIVKELDFQKEKILNKFERYEEYLSGNIDILSNSIDSISESKLAELLQMDMNNMQTLDKNSLSIVIQGRIDYFMSQLELRQSTKQSSEEYNDYIIVQNIHKVICA